MAFEQRVTRWATLGWSVMMAAAVLAGCADHRSDAATTGSFAAAKGKPKGAVLIVQDKGRSAGLPARFAASGYTTMTVDPASDLRTALERLAKRTPKAKLGAIGFSRGGEPTWSLLASPDHRLAAAAIVDGTIPPGTDIKGANAAVMLLYSGDGPVNGNRPAVEAALLGAGLQHEEKVFMGAGEGFLDTAGPQADAAYQAIVGWFDRYLA